MGELNPNSEDRRRNGGRATLSRSAGDSAGSVRLGGYLRRLRQGYGYTLRKVEEQAVAQGEAIDNSQLSRFEKGKAVPSFEKLRALARVFNVPVQSFADVLDLEEFQHLKPNGEDYSQLIRDGFDLMAKGEPGPAFVTYERALELAQKLEDPLRRAELMAQARYRMASVSKPMTAVGILVLAQQGKIDLDAEVQTYVPYFPRKRWPVTIRQLLGHLGGISHYKNYDLEAGTTKQMTSSRSKLDKAIRIPQFTWPPATSSLPWINQPGR